MKKINNTTIIEDNVTIGNNVFIGYYSIIRANVTIGNNSDIRHYCFLAGDIKIGNNVKIFQYSNIGKGSIIEDNVYIGPRVTLTNTKKISHGRQYHPDIKAPIIKYGARLGAGCIILPGVVIENECMIGAGSVVTKSTDAGWIYIGNPAKKLKKISKDEKL